MKTDNLVHNNSIESLYVQVLRKSKNLGLEHVIKKADLRKYAFDQGLVDESWIRCSLESMILVLSNLEESQKKAPARSVLF